MSDFYEDYSEYDEMVEEFKNSLLKSVKQTFLDEMEALREENRALSNIRDNWEELQYEHNKKIRELESEKQRVAYEARRMRLDQLMQDNQLTVYKVNINYLEKPKCDKCNEDRKIIFPSPTGQLHTENCECSKKIEVASPSEFVWYEFRLDEDFHVWYKKMNISSGDNGIYFSGDCTNFTEMYDGKKEYADLNYYHATFRSKEECQSYCDWFNVRKK